MYREVYTRIKNNHIKFSEASDFGGSGSGNWGHEGRPGQIGGSGEGGTSASAPRPAEIESRLSFDNSMVNQARNNATKPEHKEALDKIQKELEEQAKKDPSPENKERMEIYKKLNAVKDSIKKDALDEKEQKLSAKLKDADKTPPTSKPAPFYSEKASKMSAEEISKSLEEKGVKNNIEESIKNGRIDLHAAQEVHASIEHSIDDYGNKFNERVPGGVHVEYTTGSERLRNAYAVFHSADGHISLNKEFSDSKAMEESLKNDLAEHYHPVSTIKSVVDHETGHAFTITHGETDKIYRGDKELIEKHVGSYALANMREQYAEVFSAGRNGAISSPVVQSYFNKIDRHIRG